MMADKGAQSPNYRERFATLLMDVAKQVQQLTDEEFSVVFSGRGRLKIVVEQDGKPRRKKRKKTVAETELIDLASRLVKLDSREAALDALSETISTKSDVLRLARLLDVHTQKEDTTEHIREKLVEATVGFRLKSAAVRGTGNASDDATLLPSDNVPKRCASQTLERDKPHAG